MKNPITTITKLLTSPKGKRSNHWPTVRKHWLSTHPTCEACGGSKNIEVHHKMPFHLDPSKELDPTNFITLCEVMGSECHLKVGHTVDGTSSWKIFNPNVVNDADKLLAAKG